eukprot:4769792-Amphidinium_carterae.2
MAQCHGCAFVVSIAMLKANDIATGLSLHDMRDLSEADGSSLHTITYKQSSATALLIDQLVKTQRQLKTLQS